MGMLGTHWLQAPKCKCRLPLRMRCQAGHQYVYKRNAAMHPQVLFAWQRNQGWQCQGGAANQRIIHASTIGLENCFKKNQIRKSKLAGTNVFSETHRSDPYVRRASRTEFRLPACPCSPQLPRCIALLTEIHRIYRDRRLKPHKMSDPSLGQ